jgi:acetyl esterase/lipase
MRFIYCFLLLLFTYKSLIAQNSARTNILKLLPQGTRDLSNIPYQVGGHAKHLLNIYFPAEKTKKTYPLVVFIHGGAWIYNDNYADLNYMSNTVSGLLDAGYAVASIDYRFASEAPFPANLQDCNQAVNYLITNASEYSLDPKNIALMGFSAGGHLASMLALANNAKVKNHFSDSKPKFFPIKCVIDYYGPILLEMFPNANNPSSPESKLLGATPISRPDLAQKASPLHYIDPTDPPFLIIHGEKDDLVHPNQSMLLESWLKINKVKTQLIIVKNAPHYGEMFDSPELKTQVLHFLKNYLK